MSIHDLAVKLFSDGADKSSMVEMASKPYIAGLTTNPSLMKKAGVTDYPKFCLDILNTITNKPISFEVFSDELSEMKRQALIIHSWGEITKAGHQNIYVKIPVINSEGRSTLSLVKELTKQGIHLNITAIHTLDQVRETCEALKGGAPSYVSVFAGRVADTGRDPMPLMKEALRLCRNAGSQVELLWASTREVYNILQANDLGCDIITVPPDILKKLDQWGKDPLAVSLDTVKTFKKDSESAGFKL